MENLPGIQEGLVVLKKLKKERAATITKNKAQKPETFMMTKPQSGQQYPQNGVKNHTTSWNIYMTLFSKQRSKKVFLVTTHFEKS